MVFDDDFVEEHAEITTHVPIKKRIRKRFIIFLRWHYPDQVCGSVRTPSQPKELPGTIQLKMPDYHASILKNSVCSLELIVHSKRRRNNEG
jgi:hypothetical protein